MHIIEAIHAEIERISEQRTELWKRLSLGRNPDLVAEIKAIDAKLDSLWDAQRAERARIRFGERENIVKRARAEERLERAEQQRRSLLRAKAVGLERRLEGLNPLAILERGYAVVRRRDGSVVRSVDAVESGARIGVRVSDGEFRAKVIDVSS